MPEQAPPDQLDEMFIRSGICKQCGAQVAIPEQHKAFHDGIERAFEAVAETFQRAGFETREQRAARRRSRRPASEDGAGR
jgi:hypothetical protein